MFRDHKPKLLMTKTQSNVLMSQIRAEQKYYREKHDPIYTNVLRDQKKRGKKVFKEQLCQASLFDQSKNEQGKNRSYTYLPSYSPSRREISKRTGYEISQKISKPSPIKERRHIIGKIFENILQFDPCKNVNEASPLKYMKKRFDLSPINQSRLSPGFNLFA